MKQSLQSAINYLNALSVRERVLVLLVICAVIIAITDTLILSKLEKQYQQQLNKQQQLTQQQQEINNTLNEVATKIAENNTAKERTNKAIHDTKQQLQQKSKQLNTVLDKLVPPTKITELLRSLLLKQSESLKVISLNNEPVEIITLNNDQMNGSPKTVLYKHAATIRLVGNYQQLHHYLSKLEDSNWELFWEQLNYSVTAYPNAEIMLRVHTISTDEYWIGL